MTTFDELILSQEVQLEQSQKQRERAVAEMRMILAKAKNEGRANLTEEEDADMVRAAERRDKYEREIRGIQAQLSKTREAAEHEAQLERDAATIRTDPHNTTQAKPAYDRVARVGREERTYNPETSRKGKEFLNDVVGQFLHGDLEAQMRLSRHMQEERVERGAYLKRATGTGAFAGLTVPQYLTEMYAPQISARRPFADICTSHDLPADGMNVNISRITTGSSVDLQANENDAVSETNMDDTLLTENIQTAAGQQTISRQALERGTGIEDVTMRDLQRKYAAKLDGTLLNQASTGLSALGVVNSFTTPVTPAGLWPKILSALSGSEAAFLGEAAPDYVVMHPRRWYWMQSQVGSTWPFITQPNVATQAGGVNLGVTYDGGVRGVLPNGTLVVCDANITTAAGAGTEDEIYVVASDELHLWEDPSAPQFIRAEQAKAANLGVLLVLYGYFAYSFRRYANGVQKVSGAGLIAPTFS
jgi:HK97 family phage major capsid protein